MDELSRMIKERNRVQQLDPKEVAGNLYDQAVSRMRDNPELKNIIAEINYSPDRIVSKYTVYHELRKMVALPIVIDVIIRRTSQACTVNASFYEAK